MTTTSYRRAPTSHDRPATCPLVITAQSNRPMQRYGRPFNSHEEITLMPIRDGAGFVFGRSAADEIDLTLGLSHDPTRPDGVDLSISGLIGSVHCEQGLLWFLTNHSESRPIKILSDNPHPAGDLIRVAYGEDVERCPIAPPGLTVEIGDPGGDYYRLSFTLRPPPGGSEKVQRRVREYRAQRTDPRTQIQAAMRRPNEATADGRRDLIILAAKFLLNSVPINSVGDIEAAEYATRALEKRGGAAVDHRQVQRLRADWADTMERCDPDYVRKRESDRLGYHLLAWGVIRRDDGKWLL